MALSRLTLYICQFQCFEVTEISDDESDSWVTLLKDMITTATNNKRTVVLNIQDNQMPGNRMLLELDCLLKNGFLPGLFVSSE